MSNSNLVNYTKLSPNCTKPRKNKIEKITIHHMAGNLSVESCGNVFANKSRKASANYGIDSDGRVGLYVDEANRSWCSSNAANDNKAVTIEVANDEIGGNWHVSDKALNKLIELCVDICKRNNIEKLIYTGNKSGNLTEHNYFVATTCPGSYLKSKLPYIADEVNKHLSGVNNVGKSVDEIAKEVLAGKWGNGDERKNKLKAAGYDYAAVQAKVNELLGNKTTVKPISAINVGDTVKIKSGAPDYNGKKLASFIYNRKFKVSQIKGDRVVIKYLGVTIAAVHKNNLTKV